MTDTGGYLINYLACFVICRLQYSDPSDGLTELSLLSHDRAIELL